MDPKFKDSYIVIENKKIIEMSLRFDDNCSKIPKEINNFKFIQGITVYLDNMDFNADGTNFLNIYYLVLSVRETSKQIRIKNLSKFPNLESITIVNEGSYKRILKQNNIPLIKPPIKIPNNIGELKKLESFSIKNCCVQELPNSITHLSNLKWLILYNLDLKSIPENTLTL